MEIKTNNMKKSNSNYGSLTVLLSVSCEEVIDVNLNTGPPKLVIEASINWLKGTQEWYNA
jgi:hypothetical protein